MYRTHDETNMNEDAMWSLEYTGARMRVTKKMLEVSILSIIYAEVSNP